MARLRILHLVTRSQRRGAEVVALELTRQLDALGHHDRIVALGPAFDGSVEAELPTLVGRVNLGGARGLLALRRALRRELATRPVDLVLAHGGQPFQAAILGRGLLGRGAPTPPVVWQRILPFPASIWRLPRKTWWSVLARRADAAVVLTPDLESELRRLGLRAPVWTIQNFRDAEPFAGLDRDRATAALRAETGIPDGTAVLGLVGHLIEQKEPLRALDVLEGVEARGERAHLVVAGDGPLRRPLEAAARARGLAGSVHVLGERRDIAAVLGGIDVLVSTSASEGVPGVLIEALMAGCPVVGMRVGGVSTVVHDGVTGLLVAPGAVDALADRVVELLRDPPRRASFSAAGRACSDEFSATRAARLYAERFGELLGGSAPD